MTLPRGHPAVAGPLTNEPHCYHWYYDDDAPCCRCGYDGPDETTCPGRATPQ